MDTTIEEILEKLSKACCKIAQIRDVCLKCGYTWASWEESHTECVDQDETINQLTGGTE